MIKHLLIVCAFVLLAVSLTAAPAFADGPQFNVNCTSISWTRNTEADLAGYKLFDRVSLSNTPTVIKTFGSQVATATCASLGLNSGQHYLSIYAFDTSGNMLPLDPTREVPFTIIPDAAISNLTITAISSTSMTLRFTEVDGGLGSPASYDVRFDVAPMDWGSAPSVTSGTCTTPLAGTTIGALKSCTITGLTNAIAYQAQLVPFRGTLGVDAVFSPFSNIVSGTTGAALPSSARTTSISDAFNRANGSLTTPWLVGYTGQQTPAINSNAVRSPTAGGAQALAVYNATTPNDQWGHISIPTIQGASAVSVFVKLRHANNPTMSGYECRANRNNASVKSEIAKRVSGSSTTLISENVTTWASGDELDCEIQGNTLIMSRVSGGVTTVLLTVTDTTYTTGKTGFAVTSIVLGDGVIDNFAAGGFTAAVVADICGCDQH